MWSTHLFFLLVALAPRLASASCGAQGRGVLWSGGDEWLDESAFCRGVTMAQGCHDSGRMAQLSLETPTTATFWASEDPGYWERGSVWPAECGRPAMVHGASNAEEVCGTWRPMDAAGHPMGTVTTCVALPSNFTGELVETFPADGPGALEGAGQGDEVGERAGDGDAPAPSDGAAQTSGACETTRGAGPAGLGVVLALLCGLLAWRRAARATSAGS